MKLLIICLMSLMLTPAMASDTFPNTSKPLANISKDEILKLAMNSRLIVEGKVEPGHAVLDGFRATVSPEKVLLGRSFKPVLSFFAPPVAVPGMPVIVFFSSNTADQDGSMPLISDNLVWMVSADQEADVIAALKSLPVDSPQFSDITPPSDFVDLATLSPECRADLTAVKRGMTRNELESKLSADGGISSAFRYERYVYSKCADGKRMIKLDLQLRPANISDQAYFDGAMPYASSPSDTVWSVSLPYYQKRIND